MMHINLQVMWCYLLESSFILYFLDIEIIYYFNFLFLLSNKKIKYVDFNFFSLLFIIPFIAYKYYIFNSFLKYF